MARLGRRQPNLQFSRVRNPVVVGPIAKLPKLSITLASQATRRQYQPQVTTRSFRITPTVVGPIAFVPPIKTRLAVQSTRRLYSISYKTKIAKPTILQAPIVPTGISATSNMSGNLVALRGVQSGVINATSAMGGTFVTGGPPQPVQRQIATVFARRNKTYNSRIIPPGYIDPATSSTPPVVTKLAITSAAVRTRQDFSKRSVQHKFSTPLVATPSIPIPFGGDRIRINKPIQPKPFPGKVSFISPTIVNPIVMLPQQKQIRTTLTAVTNRGLRNRIRTTYRIGKPVQQPSVATITSGTINATSTMSATVTRTVAIGLGSINSTSTMSGSVVRLAAVRAGVINATSNMGGALSGGTGGSTFRFVSSPAPAILWLIDKEGPLA